MRPDPRPGPDGAAAAAGPVAHLVHLAVGSDRPGPLLTAAAEGLRRPVGLAGSRGEPLGHAPDDAGGRRAEAVAAAAARTGAAARPGWRVVPVAPGGARMAVPAAAGRAPDVPEAAVTVELVADLLGDQLARAALRRGQAAALVGRLLHDPTLAGERARRVAAAAGVDLAPAYWPAVVACAGDPPSADLADHLDRELADVVPGALCALVDDHLVVLHPDGDGGPPPVRRFEQVAASVRRRAPGTRARVYAAHTPAAPGELAAQVTQLARLGRRDTESGGGPPVVIARRYELDRLLCESLAPADARGFVEDRLGALIAWDRDHRTDLLHVLEAALDFPRHEQAARRCFMHRNTFRHRFRQAAELVGGDLDDPDARLAVHVALKLRRALPAGGAG